MELEVGKRVKVANVVIASAVYNSVRTALLKMEGVVIGDLGPAAPFRWKVELDNNKTYFFATVELETIEGQDQLLATKPPKEPAQLYYVVSAVGGAVKITEETKASLLKLLDDDDLGIGLAYTRSPSGDPRWWGASYLIIKGEIVIPRINTRPVKFVRKITLERAIPL